MNIKIHKYLVMPHPLQKATDPISVMMPKEAKLLDALFMDENLYIWAEHQTYFEEIMEERKFYVIPTGVPIELHYSVKYFRTAQSSKMGLIFHLYEQTW